MNLQIASLLVLGVFTIATASAAESAALGKVKVDAAARAISFRARVNMVQGQVEYLLVHEAGKVHESIFKTDVGAAEIHAAALLFSTNTNPKLKVAAIEATWAEAGKNKTAAAPGLIWDRAKKRPLRETRWAYRGSRLIDGVFLAQRDGSQIAIMHDRDSLIDQDTPEAADDQNWEPVKEALPAIGTAVTISIRFEK